MGPSLRKHREGEIKSHNREGEKPEDRENDGGISQERAEKRGKRGKRGLREKERELHWLYCLI